jgi:uncharacterized lipoprotein YmbA
MKTAPLFLGLAAGLFAAGCGTTKPARFFQLNPDPPLARSEPVPGTPPWTLRNVRLPRYLDRSQMILRLSAHAISLDEYNRWAEPLDAGVTRLLRPFNGAVGAEPWLVDLELVLFDVDASGNAILEASWQARPPRSGPPAAGSFARTRKAAGPDPGEQAAALSELILELGAEIGKGLRQKENSE